VEYALRGDEWKGWQDLASVTIRPLSARRGCDWNRYHGVAIESDDWGLCGEGKNRAAHDRLSARGYSMDSEGEKLNYTNTLETTEDLEGLYQTLGAISDSLGRNPILTANFIMTNPCYSKIQEARYTKYHFMPITEGFPGGWASRNSVVDAWRSGIQRKLLIPEYHGFSHFNHSMWLTGLKRGDKRLLDFFKEEMFTTSVQHPTISEYGILKSNSVVYPPLWTQYRDIKLGCEIFRKAFNRYPRSTIPPHDVSNPQTLVAFAKAGIRQVQSERRRLTGILGVRPPRPRSMFNAVARVITQLTLVFRGYRNVRLEQDEVEGDMALESSVEIMRNGRPVAVGSHRQNYVSGIEPRNAEKGRRRLAAYLSGLSEDPKLVFLSSFEASQLSFNGHSVEKFGDEFLIRNYTRGDLIILAEGARRCVLKDLRKEQPGTARVEDVKLGARVFAPAGRTLILTPQN
jgi:hypothetical protein